MNRSESVLETLERDAPAPALQPERARLEVAIIEGEGHIVVLGASQRASDDLVEAVLQSIEGYQIEVVSVHTAPCPIAGAPVLVVVYDADTASAAELDTLRMAWEEGCDAMARVRLILLGSQALTATLATDEAR